jgi:hypothetical protein
MIVEQPCFMARAKESSGISPQKLANWAEAGLRLLARIEGERNLIFFDQAETCFTETPKAAMSFQ